MAIKQFTFTFKLDAKELLEYVSERNVAVDIQAFGTGPKPKPQNKPQKLTAPAKQLSLPAPGKRSRKLGAKNAVIGFFLMHHGEEVTLQALRDMLVSEGFSAKTAHTALWTLKGEGMIKKPAGTKGVYRPTAKLLKQNGEEATHG